MRTLFFSILLVGSLYPTGTPGSVANSYYEYASKHDTDAPVLTLKQESVTITEGDVFVPTDYLAEAYDVFDEVPILTISEDYDTSTPGEYEIHFTLRDESDNVAEATLTLQVKKAVDSKILDMFNRINALREEAGLDPYRLGGEAALSAAKTRAKEAYSSVSHTRPDGTSYKTALDDEGISYSTAGEILTYAGSSVSDKLNWWLNSEGHRNQLYSENYTKIAIGYYKGMWAALIYK